MRPVRWSVPRSIRVADYDGGSELWFAGTQLSPAEFSRREAARILDEWCEFFAAGPTPIKRLGFDTRLPNRLFESLVGQPQLELLDIKWGDYADLQVLRAMAGLRSLHLGGSARFASLGSLSDLESLEALTIENAWHVHDFSPLGRVTSLKQLRVASHGRPGGRGHADSLAFVANLDGLNSLAWQPIVDDADYSPLLALQTAEWIHVVGQPGMFPSYLELEWALPGVQAHERALASQVIPIRGLDGEPIGEIRRDSDRRFRVHPNAFD